MVNLLLLRGSSNSLISITFIVLIVNIPSLSAKELSLENAVNIAQGNDPWIEGSYQRELATLAQSVAAGQLPDPVISVGFANMPLDTFNFNQDPMTQFKVGVSQAFPRGDSLALQQQKLEELSRQHPFMRQDRQAKVRLSVSHLWLDLFKSQETIRLIEKDRSLFEYLVDVAEVNYSSASGRSRQQDLVRSQLELTRLEDRLTLLNQNRHETQAKLDEWLFAIDWQAVGLPQKLPELELKLPSADTESVNHDQVEASVFRNHPTIKILDEQITSSETNVDLTKQKYKPQWGVNTSYSYRDDAPTGQDRSDFFSVSISFDLPVFIEKKQDKEVQAAIGNKEALKTDKALALRMIHASFNQAKERLQWLEKRKTIYDKRLLQEMQEQAEASLNAYTNDDGDFAEVIRARIAELNANIDYLNINIDRLKAIAELNYFATSVAKNTYHQRDEK
ncbi:MAG: TolC family protein [Gammaproteobacteria bacterium]|nr:TolC family protein [Gammaproteobacteria bacterium]